MFFVFFGLQTDPGALLPVAGIALLLAVAGIAHQDARPAGGGARGPASASPAGSAPAPRCCPAASSTSSSPGWPSAAGINPQLGPLAAAYVLILAVTGPLAARAVEPLAKRLMASRRRRRRRAV